MRTTVSLLFQAWIMTTPVISASPLERHGIEFKIFQFPADQIPRIDAQADDWEIVGAEYVIGTDQLADTE